MYHKPVVVIVADWFDPAFRAGGPVRSMVNMIDHLHDKYNFKIICGSVDYGEKQELTNIHTEVWTDWQGKAEVYYMSVIKQRRKHIFKLLNEVDGDIIYVQGIFSKTFSILPLVWWKQAKRGRLVVAPRGMLYASALRIKRLKKRMFLFVTKAMGWYNHVVWHSTNKQETREIKEELGPKAEIIEASNFPVWKNWPEHIPDFSGQALKILSVTRISDEKNPLLLIAALSGLDIPIELRIAGDYSDEEYFHRFTERIKALPANIKVHYLGSVPPDEMSALYENSQLFVLPTRGENFGHAIAEALIYGLPCILGDNTPWTENVQGLAGWCLPMQASEFQKAIQAFYEMNATDKENMSKAARKVALTLLNAYNIKKDYLKLFDINSEED
jgi:glycosyltransferase involved in cell wall biosynthesis